MNEISQALVDGLLEREEIVGSSINWAGVNYPCSGGAELGGKLLGEGGYRVTAQVPIVVRTSVFPPGVGRPKEKQLITYTSVPGATAKALSINAVTTFYDAFLVLECDATNQGA